MQTSVVLFFMPYISVSRLSSVVTIFCLFANSSGMDETETACYNTFVSNLNWRDNPVAPVSEFPPQSDPNWIGEATNAVDRIQWTALVNDLVGPPAE